MLVSRRFGRLHPARTHPAFALALLSFSALALTLLLFSSFASPAGAEVSPPAQPATVTVRVEGLDGNTLLPQASVTTTSAPIAAEGHTCSGTSAGGALYDAVHGNWVVKYGAYGYEIDGIAGLDFPAFSPTNPPDAYWSFWLDNVPATQGACEQELSPGATVVFFPQCLAVGPDCVSATAPDHFLTSTAPSATVVQAGASVSVNVGSTATGSGSPEASLPAGVLVSAGAVSAAPDAQGTATLVFPSAGTYTIQAHAPDSVPSDPYTVCVHNGNDGTCGTTAPGGTTGVKSPVGAGTPVNTATATVEVAKIAGVGNGRIFSRHAGPRYLSGSVVVPVGDSLRQVRISLKRRHFGRCYGFNGSKERFISLKCDRAASWFSVGTSSSFSYLLPARLPAGRYTYEIDAVDGAGHVTQPVSGVSHVVFRVK